MSCTHMRARSRFEHPIQCWSTYSVQRGHVDTSKAFDTMAGVRQGSEHLLMPHERLATDKAMVER